MYSGHFIGHQCPGRSPREAWPACGLIWEKDKQHYWVLAVLSTPLCQAEVVFSMSPWSLVHRAEGTKRLLQTQVVQLIFHFAAAFLEPTESEMQFP